MEKPATFWSYVRQLSHLCVTSIERAYAIDAVPETAQAQRVAYWHGSWQPSEDDLAPKANDVLGALALAGVFAAASRNLAIERPGTLGVVGFEGDARACVLMHLAHGPLDARVSRTLGLREVKIAETVAEVGNALASALTWEDVVARVTGLDEALSCDIVCISSMPEGIPIASSSIRAGTHLNLVASVSVDAELRRRARWISARDFGLIAGGLVDGWERDDVTIFVADDLTLARYAAATTYLAPTR